MSHLEYVNVASRVWYGMVWYGGQRRVRLGILRFISKVTPALPVPMSSCTITGPLRGWDNRTYYLFAYERNCKVKLCTEPQVAKLLPTDYLGL